MPIQYPDPQPPQALCDACDAPVAYVEAEDSEESPNGYRFDSTGIVLETFTWRLPENWVQFVGSRPIDNPNYEMAKAEGRAQMQAQYDMAAGMLQQAGLTDEQKAEVQAELAELASEIEQYEPDEPFTIIQQLEGVLCPPCSVGLQSRLGLDDWPPDDGGVE